MAAPTQRREVAKARQGRPAFGEREREKKEYCPPALSLSLLFALLLTAAAAPKTVANLRRGWELELEDGGRDGRTDGRN